MASLSFTQFLSLPRWGSNLPCHRSPDFVKLQGFRLHDRLVVVAAGRKKISESPPQDEAGGLEGVVEKKAPRKRAASRTRKKKISVETQEILGSGLDNEATTEESIASASVENTTTVEKTTTKPRKTRKKATATSSDAEEEKVNTAKKDDEIEDSGSASETSDVEESTFIENVDSEGEENIDLEKYEGEDISHTYGWPPLVCCFGTSQYAFVPSGRRANRLIDHEYHERMKDAFWAPEKFTRSPGGTAGGVAIALASLGGNVAFMGKLGDDDFGQTLLYYLNVCKVQTRAVKMDTKRPTAVSLMKIGKRNRLKMTCVKPCAEDSLSKSEINIDVLKEAKMFYFSTQSLLDRKMRSTTLQAVKIAKQLGSVIFYDVNLPLPLWQTGEEAKTFVQEFWNLADIVEVTKQELEFLCGINPTEEFDTRNNNSSKFVHYEPEIIKTLWHENLKVLFVTNGTSKIHYYTKEDDGSVHGMEAPPITPFTSDMSASGDGIVAGLMRMLTVQPDLMTDKGYLERSIAYAIDCGVIDQWLLAQTRGYPPRDDMDIDEIEPDSSGIRSITEKEYRTVESAS